MKKYLLILAMFGFVLYGCDQMPDEVEDDTTQTTPPAQQPDDETEEPHFAITGDGAFAIPFGGGEFEVAVETNLEYTVAIPENAKSWVSVKATRTLRTETVVFAVAANNGEAERSTAVTFIDENGQTLQTITIKQDAKPEEKEPNEPEDPNDPEEPEKPQFGITGEVMFAMPAEGGEFEVAVETNLEYTVAISEDAQLWINLKETRALRTETLVFAVAANDSSEERSTAIAFIGEDGKTLQTIAIKQEAAPEEDEPDEPDEEGIPLNEIHYTSSDGNIVEPNSRYYYFGDGVNLVSNTYENGVGILKFDNPVTQIGSYTFAYCTTLTSIIIPESVTEIRANTFDSCISLTSITISNSVIKIGYAAFLNCPSLTSITIPESVTTIGYEAFSGCYSLTSITIPDSVTEIGDHTFHYCTSLTSITIPEGVTKIGDYAFDWCDSLTSITIPNSVIEIGRNPFYGCSSLSEFRGKYASDDGRCLIVDSALNSSTPVGLTEYSIPESVTEIGAYAFVYCRSLTSITIPESVAEIGDYAFWYCTSLESVYCKALTPPTSEYNIFYNNAYNRKIYVPYQSYYEYAWLSDWSYYAQDIVAYDFDNNVVVDGFSYDMGPKIDGEKIELTADQLYSPFTYNSDGEGLKGLVDGDTSTYWHSVYDYGIPGDETYGYYIDIALDESLNHFCFVYCTRHSNSNAVPALVTIGGSHDGTEWTVLATELECIARNRGQWAVIEAVGSASAEAYEYLRFGVTESAGGSGGNLKGETNFNSVAMSELQLYKLIE